MTRKTDINFIDNGIMITLLPNTEAGRAAYDQILAHFPEGQMPSHMLPSLKAQLKEAGYTIRKEPKNNMSIDEIFAELDAA